MVWIIVLHFTVGGISAAVLPMTHRAGYADEATCKRDIGTIKRGWAKTMMPAPDRISCEKIEVKAS